MRFRHLTPCAVLVLLLAAGCANRTERLRGKTVVITGASSGFGKGIALKMAEEGANVVLAARRTEVLDRVARDCESRGGEALVVTTDVAKQEDVEQLARAAVDRFGRIDIWINNAGVGAVGRFDEIPLKDQVRVMEINYNGVLFGSHYAMRQFRRQGAGKLINMGSIDSRVSVAYLATYNASKHAVLALTDTIDQELRLDGDAAKDIHVTTVMPWAIVTPFWDHAANYTGKRLRSTMMDDSSDVADAVVDAAKRINPKKHIEVGWNVSMLVALKNVAPDFTDDVASRAYARQLSHGEMMKPHSGALYEPMRSEPETDDGVRARTDK